MTLKHLALTGVFSVLVITSYAQVLETKNWCLSNCNIVGDELKNTEFLFLERKNADIAKRLQQSDTLIFPIRLGIVQNQDTALTISPLGIHKTIDYLNTAFKNAKIKFYIARVDAIISNLKIADLTDNFYEPYNIFSEQYDLKDTISIYLFDYDPHLCKTENGYISCSRVGGFSYVLSNRTTNVVLSKFDVEDHRVLAHEFGHFFGLYHTFEDQQFGKEHIHELNVTEVGDRISDTPADPGTLFEVYVNFSKCEMLDNFSEEEKLYYKPLIDNIMSYYKPCYLRPYTFTKGQLELLHLSAHSALRKRFSLQ